MKITPFRSDVLGNVRGTKPYMSGDDVIEDLEELEDHGTNIALNEMWRYSRLLQRCYPEETWNVLAKAGCSTALVFRRDRFRVHLKGFWPLHGHVSGPPWRRVISDAREIAWSLLSYEEDREAKFLDMVVHFTPSAWEGYLPRWWKLRTRRFWYEGRDNVRSRAASSIRAGVPVKIRGDWNHKGKSLGEYIEGQKVRYITASNGIDKEILIDSVSWEWVIDPRSIKEFDLNSDHKGRRVRLALRRKGGLR